MQTADSRTTEVLAIAAVLTLAEGAAVALFLAMLAVWCAVGTGAI